MLFRSIQYRVELPTLRLYGAGMGALAMGGGALTIYGATQEEQPVMAGLGYVSGGLQVGGGVAYGTGAVFASGDLMAVGGAAVESGGILAIPLLMWTNIKLAAENQRMMQPIIEEEIKKGNTVGAALMSMPLPPVYGF